MRTPIQGSSQYKLQMRLNMDRNCVWKHLEERALSLSLFFIFYLSYSFTSNTLFGRQMSLKICNRKSTFFRQQTKQTFTQFLILIVEMTDVAKY